MDSGDVFPLNIDLSELVRRSVATLYSHLVTRPTGQALRLGIESQIGEVQSPCLSILDFHQVAILDYSCADEAVAKLLRRYVGGGDEPEVYFVARGVMERHLEAIGAVLARHGLALVAQLDNGATELLGPVSEEERRVWRGLQARSGAMAGDLSRDLRSPADLITETLESLARRRLVLRRGEPPAAYFALSALLPPALP
jgi:hypothetical protein